MKPYKEEQPLITINKIRSILNEIGIFVTENYLQNGDYYTCRIQIANDNLLKFNMGTNGKGTSLEYAYASAYAEFMERLQNNILIPQIDFFSKYHKKDCAFNDQLNIENKKLDFIFCPEEKVIKMTKIIDVNYELLVKLFPVNNKNELKDLIIDTLKYNKGICIPFYNLKDNIRTTIKFCGQRSYSTACQV